MITWNLYYNILYYNYCIFTTQESIPVCVENIANTVVGTVKIFRGFGCLW